MTSVEEIEETAFLLAYGDQLAELRDMLIHEKRHWGGSSKAATDFRELEIRVRQCVLKHLYMKGASAFWASRAAESIARDVADAWAAANADAASQGKTFATVDSMRSFDFRLQYLNITHARSWIVKAIKSARASRERYVSHPKIHPANSRRIRVEAWHQSSGAVFLSLGYRHKKWFILVKSEVLS